MFLKNLPWPPEFIYFLTYSKRVIRLLYFVDFLNKVKFSFSTVKKCYVLSCFGGFLNKGPKREFYFPTPGRPLCWVGGLAPICK